MFKQIKREDKDDLYGIVVIKIFLQDANKQPGFSVSGSYREEIVIENATVGEVCSAIKRALFEEK